MNFKEARRIVQAAMERGLIHKPKPKRQPKPQPKTRSLPSESNLPPKSPLPKHRPRNISAANWSQRYFDIGDRIEWIDRMSDRRCTGTVSKVKRNRYGRISYLIGKRETAILTEEIFAALPE